MLTDLVSCVSVSQNWMGVMNQECADIRALVWPCDVTTVFVFNYREENGQVSCFRCHSPSDKRGDQGRRESGSIPCAVHMFAWGIGFYWNQCLQTMMKYTECNMRSASVQVVTFFFFFLKLSFAIATYSCLLASAIVVCVCWKLYMQIVCAQVIKAGSR